jgi:hypothetical protein
LRGGDEQCGRQKKRNEKRLETEVFSEEARCGFPTGFE